MKKEITVNLLKDKMKQGEVVLLDVREKHEYEFCNIKGSLHIPMNEIPQKIPELNPKKRYAIVCHSGVRSEMVTNYLVKNNFDAVNVIGGIDMWSVLVDSSVKRY
tara:strand:- start:797 stop:1111 length:315 start_codon:yes stop_codon:yes gene_type:complete